MVVSHFSDCGLQRRCQKKKNQGELPPVQPHGSSPHAFPYTTLHPDGAAGRLASDEITINGNIVSPTQFQEIRCWLEKVTIHKQLLGRRNAACTRKRSTPHQEPHRRERNRGERKKRKEKEKNKKPQRSCEISQGLVMKHESTNTRLGVGSNSLYSSLTGCTRTGFTLLLWELLCKLPN